jgi:hypothetical protein
MSVGRPEAFPEGIPEVLPPVPPDGIPDGRPEGRRQFSVLWLPLPDDELPAPEPESEPHAASSEVRASSAATGTARRTRVMVRSLLRVCQVTRGHHGEISPRCADAVNRR